MAIDSTGLNQQNFGYQTFETIADATLLTDINDSGKVLTFTHAAPVVTLHATAAGETLTFRVGKNPQTLTISPAAADAIIGCDTASDVDKDLVFTNQPVGSYVTVVGGKANAWMISAISGAFTKEA